MAQPESAGPTRQGQEDADAADLLVLPRFTCPAADAMHAGGGALHRFKQAGPRPSVQGLVQLVSSVLLALHRHLPETMQRRVQGHRQVCLLQDP